MAELKESDENIVFIDELHTLVGAGSAEGTLDAANILKPALSRGDIQCIGATTPGEYRKTIEKDRALERRFQSVKIEPPTEAEALRSSKALSNVTKHFINFVIQKTHSPPPSPNRTATFPTDFSRTKPSTFSTKPVRGPSCVINTKIAASLRGRKPSKTGNEPPLTKIS